VRSLAFTQHLNVPSDPQLLCPGPENCCGCLKSGGNGLPKTLATSTAFYGRPGQVARKVDRADFPGVFDHEQAPVFTIRISFLSPFALLARVAAPTNSVERSIDRLRRAGVVGATPAGSRSVGSGESRRTPPREADIPPGVVRFWCPRRVSMGRSRSRCCVATARA
jgi:hypothetical protein